MKKQFPAYCDVKPLSGRKFRNTRKRIALGLILSPFYDLGWWLIERSKRALYYLVAEPIIIVIRNNIARRQRKLAAGISFIG